MGIQIHIDDELELRTYTEEDAAILFTLVEENRTHLRQWLPWVDHVTSVEDQVYFVQRSLAQLDANDGFQCGIWYQGKLVGSIGFHFIDYADRKTEIGYWLAANIQGKGIMTRACKAFVNYAFEVLQLNRVEIQAASQNFRSRAIPERLGFTLEGMKREDGWLYDHFVDHVIYGILAREWSIN